MRRNPTDCRAHAIRQLRVVNWFVMNDARGFLDDAFYPIRYIVRHVMCGPVCDFPKMDEAIPHKPSPPATLYRIRQIHRTGTNDRSSDNSEKTSHIHLPNLPLFKNDAHAGFRETANGDLRQIL